MMYVCIVCTSTKICSTICTFLHTIYVPPCSRTLPLYLGDPTTDSSIQSVTASSKNITVGVRVYVKVSDPYPWYVIVIYTQ